MATAWSSARNRPWLQIGISLHATRLTLQPFEMERLVVNVDTKQRGLKEARDLKDAGQEEGQDEAQATTCEAAPVPRTTPSPGVEPFDLSIAMKALGSRPTAGQVYTYMFRH